MEDANGIPAPLVDGGRRAMPFWSTRQRVERVISAVPAYAGFVPRRLSLAEFESRWLAGMERDGLLVGINWSGAGATGYDVEPATVAEWLSATRETGRG